MTSIGFRLVDNTCRWLQIDDENQTIYGIIPEPMIKEVSERQWENGELDLLGYLY
ncbi:hypothetical protein GCM10007140_02640 [Priestia taiwanensis]|uniref:Uncharacterized protein n=1 Tax=Priestia taiwanensis TaxID=1347902 RepID=A0A917AII1_9BACI|nr:hypothetical protein GCM10007140_02640 [Priestia taiwanensis]